MAKRVVKVNIPGCELKVIPMAAIEEGERFRKDYGDLKELEYSIQTKGLIQPIVVCYNDNPEKPYKLIAGGRRFRAATNLNLTDIQARIFTDELTELELRVIELAENTIRKDMAWQEQSCLQRQIHLLQQELHGAALPGSANKSSEGGTVGWRLEDTAKMLGISTGSLSQNMRLAEKVEKFSDLGWEKCKTQADAVKMANTIDETLARLELKKRAEKQMENKSATLNSQLYDNYVISDAVDFLKKQQDEMFHFAEIDPPYSIDLTNVKNNNDCDGYVEIHENAYLIFMRKVLEETYRVLRPSAYAILWFGPDPWFEHLYKLATDVGFKTNRIPGVWIKPSGQSKVPNLLLANAYEMFFILRKGSPVLAKSGRINVFDFPPVTPTSKYHPTQKPIELLVELYKTFTFENSRVIVPFAGSGVSLLAGAVSKRPAIGADISEEFKPSYMQAVDELFPTA